MTPYADSSTMRLPYASGSHTSHAGAEAAKHSASTQAETMAAHYRLRPFTGLTDAEMSDRTGYPINVICARRSDLKCVPCGKRMGPHNVNVNAWTLPAEDA